MSTNSVAKPFPGRVVPFAPCDSRVQEARDSCVRMVGTYRGLPKFALFGGAFLIVVLVVVIAVLVAEPVAGIATVASFIGAGAVQMLIGHWAKQQDFEKFITRNEDISLTIILMVSSLTSLCFAIPFLNQDQHLIGGVVALLVFASEGALVARWAVGGYLKRKSEILGHLKGFEPVSAENLDELLKEAEGNSAFEGWMGQIKHRREPLTLHEVHAIKVQLLGAGGAD